MMGGNTDQLIEVLRQYPEFPEAIKEKAVAGSSAGAYALSTYFYSNSKRKIFDGLGILPVVVTCHYKDELEIIEELKEVSGGKLEIVLLKDYEYKIFTSG